MAVKRSGTLAGRDIQNEFIGTNGNIDPTKSMPMVLYYRGGGIVPNISVNRNIPAQPTGGRYGRIKYSDFYGSSVFAAEVTVISVTSEVQSEYGDRNDGSFSFRLDGTPSVFSVMGGGASYPSLTRGGTVSVGGRDSGYYSVTIRDVTPYPNGYPPSLSWVLGVVIGYGGGSYISFRGSNYSKNQTFSLPR